MSRVQHTHQLTDGQLICNNEYCREKVLEKIQKIKTKKERRKNLVNITGFDENEL
jgi:cell fate regulator YaaT (PSP1 superfamily)